MCRIYGKTRHCLPSNSKKSKTVLRAKEVYLPRKDKSPWTSLRISHGTLIWQALPNFVLYPTNACQMNGHTYDVGGPAGLKCLSWAPMPTWDTLLSHLAQEDPAEKRCNTGEIDTAPSFWVFQVEGQGESCVWTHCSTVFPSENPVPKVEKNSHRPKSVKATSVTPQGINARNRERQSWM